MGSWVEGQASSLLPLLGSLLQSCIMADSRDLFEWIKLVEYLISLSLKPWACFLSAENINLTKNAGIILLIWQLKALNEEWQIDYILHALRFHHPDLATHSKMTQGGEWLLNDTKQNKFWILWMSRYYGHEDVICSCPIVRADQSELSIQHRCGINSAEQHGNCVDIECQGFRGVDT